MPYSLLPVDAVLPDVLFALKSAGAVILRAPTGAGKTTRVPPALVESGLCDSCRVLLLEPRRVAARAAARRMAQESGTPLGGPYGYHVRFDRKFGRDTRCVALTPGILLRTLHDDPYLESVSAVVFDEFHERGVEADLALGLCKLLRESVRPELKIVVMSATVDPGPIRKYLGDCPVVTSEGRTFPVTVRYKPKRPEQTWPEATAAAVREVLAEQSGDVLAFLPGLGEIRRTADLLEGLDAEILPLHGDLPPEQQDRAMRTLERRKVVLATNVAETSVTVEGVTAVIDTGLARHLVHDSNLGMDRLTLGPISRASADQRTGRAGRTAPGVCVRLWDEFGHKSRPEQTVPELLRVDLAGPVLQLLALGEADPRSFPWLDPPPAGGVDRAFRLLTTLGLVRDNALTPDGSVAARLPVHPRLGRLLVSGHRHGVPDRAALAAAILADRDPFERPPGPPTRSGPPTESDLLDRVEALEEFDRTGRLESSVGRLHRGGARAGLDGRDQFLRTLRDECGISPASADPDESLLRATFEAYADRLAKRRGPQDRRAVTADGRGLRLGPTSGVIEPELFVAVDADAGGADSLVRVASGVRREWLDPARLTTRHELEYDDAADRLIARKRTRFDELILDDLPGHIGDESLADATILAAALRFPDRCFPVPDSAAGELFSRIRWLNAAVPHADLPKFDDESILELLPEVTRGKRSLAAVRSGPWADAIRNRLTYPQQQFLDREAPTNLEVPTGSRIALAYEHGKPPVLAVRIQELFGLTETPRVACGRVPVLLHLLAPNGRPQQVTADLASFWKNGYPLVRKDLRGRYPKHSWPDDPTTAEPLRGPKRKT
jgi:ATP-dependent helicase HrpB